MHVDRLYKHLWKNKSISESQWIPPWLDAYTLCSPEIVLLLNIPELTVSGTIGDWEQQLLSNEVVGHIKSCGL